MTYHKVVKISKSLFINPSKWVYTCMLYHFAQWSL